MRLIHRAGLATPGVYQTKDDAMFEKSIGFMITVVLHFFCELFLPHQTVGTGGGTYLVRSLVGSISSTDSVSSSSPLTRELQAAFSALQ